MKPLIPMRHALEDPDLFGGILAGASWDKWRVLLIAILGEALTDSEREIFSQLTGRTHESNALVEEAWLICGRRSGKTRAACVLAAYLAALCDISDMLAPGERATLPILSASLWQAGKAFGYLDGIFNGVPALRKLVTNQTSDTISLSTRVDLECRPASFRTIRGGTFAALIADEVAYWRSEDSQNPDVEILNAARPSLATTGGPLICISSPYAKRGALYEAYRDYFGATGDSLVLVAKAASRDMNSTLPLKVVARAYQRDSAAASAEYGAEFRSDIESFVSWETVNAAVILGRYELMPVSGISYHGFTDPAGGSGADSMTAAVSHRTRDGTLVLDALREARPPFSPEAIVVEFADFFKSYHIGRITGDHWGGEFVRQPFSKCGIVYEKSDKPKSDIYRDCLPLLNSSRIELLDNDRLINQIASLERKTARSGKDSTDHPPHGHDDICNAALGALLLASSNAGSYTLTAQDVQQLSRVGRPQSSLRAVLPSLIGFDKMTKIY